MTSTRPSGHSALQARYPRAAVRFLRGRERAAGTRRLSRVRCPRSQTGCCYYVYAPSFVLATHLDRRTERSGRDKHKHGLDRRWQLTPSLVRSCACKVGEPPGRLSRTTQESTHPTARTCRRPMAMSCRIASRLACNEPQPSKKTTAIKQRTNPSARVPSPDPPSPAFRR